MKDMLSKGNSIVFLWNKNIGLEDATFFDIEKEMKAIFKKADLIE